MPRLADQKNIWVPGPVHTTLTALQDAMTRDKGRAVSLGEVVEWLISLPAAQSFVTARREGA